MAERTSRTYATNFRYLVVTGEDSFSKEPSAGDVCFSKISGIEASAEQEEILEGGKNDGPHILIAPHKRHQPLVLEQGAVPENSWLCRLKPGMRLGTWLVVILLDEKGKPTKRRFGISDGMVAKWELSGLDAMSSLVLVEKLEIIHDGIVYQ